MLTDTSSMLVAVIFFVVMMYLFMIRPENKRKKEQSNMRASLQAGDEVVTVGGIVGTICFVKDNNIVIETGADRVRIEVAKWAIGEKVPQNNQAAK